MNRFCWECGETVGEALFCPRCHKIQPPDERSYFAILDMPERLEIDCDELEAHYHSQARQVHPDRFMTRSERERAYATEQAESLNRAYRTLRDPWARARYLLDLQGVSIPKGQLPADLAEEYFELMDVSDAKILEGFREKLTQILKQQELTFHDELLAWEASPADEKVSCLSRISERLGNRSYLESLRLDLEKRSQGFGK